MSRTTYDPREEYIGTGLLTEYTFDFKITALEDLLIIKTNAAFTEVFRVDGNDTTYLDTVTFDATAGGGTVTLVDELESGYYLFILMADENPLQEYLFRAKGDFTMTRFEAALDVLSGQIQTLTYRMNRVPRLPETMLDSVGFDPEIATVVAADKIIAINTTGNGFELIDNPEDLTMAAIGATPNANGGTFVSNILTLQPADSTYGGLLTAIAQAIAGVKTFIDHIIRSASSGITAYSGGGQASATSLTKFINRVTTVAAIGDSVKLPAAVAGMEIVVINSGASTMNIYPQTGETIDAMAVNAPYGLSTAAKVVRFLCAVTGAWVGGSVSATGGGVTVTGTAASPTLIIAGTGVVFAGSDMFNTAYISGNGGAVTVSANPQITAGTVTGQRLRLIVPAGGNQITLADGTGLSLDGGTWIGAAGSSLDLEWNATVWFETGRRTA